MKQEFKPKYLNEIMSHNLGSHLSSVAFSIIQDYEANEEKLLCLFSTNDLDKIPLLIKYSKKKVTRSILYFISKDLKHNETGEDAPADDVCLILNDMTFELLKKKISKLSFEQLDAIQSKLKDFYCLQDGVKWYYEKPL